MKKYTRKETVNLIKELHNLCTYLTEYQVKQIEFYARQGYFYGFVTEIPSGYVLPCVSMEDAYFKVDHAGYILPVTGNLEKFKA